MSPAVKVKLSASAEPSAFLKVIPVRVPVPAAAAEAKVPYLTVVPLVTFTSATDSSPKVN